MKSVPDTLLEGIRNNKGFLNLYMTGMSSLYQSRVFDFLREIGRARLIGLGGDVQVMSCQASYSIGYNQCLEDLFYFKEKFLEAEASKDAQEFPDYGGLEIALKKGDITQEEYDTIKRQPPVK